MDHAFQSAARQSATTESKAVWRKVYGNYHLREETVIIAVVKVTATQIVLANGVRIMKKSGLTTGGTNTSGRHYYFMATEQEVAELPEVHPAFGPDGSQQWVTIPR